MSISERSVSLQEVIKAISSRQAIVNINQLKSQLDTIQPISSLNSLKAASQGELSFLSDEVYSDLLEQTKASIVMVSPKCVDDVPVTAVPIVVTSPYLAYGSVSVLFDSSVTALGSTYIHPTAQIDKSVTLGERVSIGAYCVIGQDTTVGTGTQIQANTVIGNNVSIGEECVINAHVSIAHDCHIGNAVRIHSHATIGSEGFGFAPTNNPADDGWQRIAQLGSVVIGDNVRIGSQTCIDRGAIDNTVIEDNVIIDNLVQIAHNVRIGAGSAIASKTGIAGSTTIGKRCIIGGAVGIVGHIDIVDDVTLTSMTMVTKSIKKSGSYSSGTVAMPTIDWRRAAVRFRNMGKKSKR